MLICAVCAVCAVCSVCCGCVCVLHAKVGTANCAFEVMHGTQPAGACTTVVLHTGTCTPAGAGLYSDSLYYNSPATTGLQRAGLAAARALSCLSAHIGTDASARPKRWDAASSCSTRSPACGYTVRHACTQQAGGRLSGAPAMCTGPSAPVCIHTPHNYVHRKQRRLRTVLKDPAMHGTTASPTGGVTGCNAVGLR